MSSDAETYTLAHTAQCKLKLAANRPDRNLRFVLGHAFMLDNLMLKIVEIENQQSKSPPKFEASAESTTRRVSFRQPGDRPSCGLPDEPQSSKPSRRASPPPDASKIHHEASDSDSDEYAFDEYDEEDDTSLGLTRFTSASAQPPRTIDPESDSSDDDDDDQPKSPPSMPSEAELRTITGEEGDEEMADLYNSVRSCACHGLDDQKAPPASMAWEIPQPESEKQAQMTRTAVIRLNA